MLIILGPVNSAIFLGFTMMMDSYYETIIARFAAFLDLN